jgi:hypothetical protein
MKKVLLLILLTCTFAITAEAQYIFTPDTTYYQGFVTDNNGFPLNGTFSAQAVLVNEVPDRFDAFNGTIQIINGYFNIPILLESNILGDFKYIGQNLWIEITIDGKKFDPMIKIVSVPIAKVAQTADSTLRISDGAITDIKVAPNAAISGLKINPDFGSQIVRTASGIDIGGRVVTRILDEDDMASDADDALATQQSIRAYLDANNNQNLTEVLTGGNDAGAFAIANMADPVNPQDAATKAYVDANSSDDQGLILTGDILTIEDGTGSVDLSNYIGTDDQQISFDENSNELTLEDGGVVDLSILDDPGTDDQGLIMSGDILSIENGTGTINLSNYIGTDDQGLILTGDVLSIEDGTGTVDLSNYVGSDDQQMTYSPATFILSLEDGGTVDLSGLNDSGTDDQLLTYSPATFILSLEDGGTVDLSGLNDSGTDDQDLILTGDVLSIENGLGSVDLSNYFGSDDQLLTYTPATNILSLEDGGTVDLSGLNDPGSDDQQMTYSPATFILSLEDGGTVDLSGLNDSGTDDQNLILTGDILSIENGLGSVDLSNYFGTDDQLLTYTPATNILSLEDGGTVDLSGLNDSGTDDQLLTYTPATNILSLEDGGTVDLSGLNDSGTDDQQIYFDYETYTLELEDGGYADLSGLNDSGTDDQNLILTGDVLSIENGLGSVDLSNYFGTDDQLLTYTPATNLLSLEDGGTVDLSGLNDSGTDDQLLTYTPATNILSLEDGGTVDLSGLNDSGTDDQLLTYTPATNILSLEDGGTVDLSGLNDSGTDDQQIYFDYETYTLELEDGGYADLSGLNDSGTDDQDLILTGDVLSIENGLGSVDLSNYFGTDDQLLTYTPATNILSLEDGGTVDLSGLNDSGTDDQLLTYTPATNLLSLEDGGTVDLSGLNDSGTDDQLLTYTPATNLLSLEDGGTVDLSGLNDSGTDDQLLTYTPATNLLSLEDGGTVDLSGLNDSGTDDQQIYFDYETYTLELEDGGYADLSGLNDSGTDDQDLILTGDVLSIENGLGSVDLSNYFGTDDQLLTYTPATNILSLEDGGTVDLSGLNDSGTDDQQIYFDYETYTLELEDGGYADLSGLNDSGTDDQNLILTGDVLSIENGFGSVDLSNYLGTDDQLLEYNDQTFLLSLEDGGTVDLSGLNNSGSDDQDLILTGDVLSIENGLGSVDLSNYFGTDDQLLSYTPATNLLSLEDGGTVDLSGLNDPGSDDQLLTYSTETNILSLEDGGTVDLSGLNNSGSDDQNLILAGDVLSIENGLGSVDLSNYIGTDDQLLQYNDQTFQLSLEDGGSVDLSGLNNSGTDDQILSLNKGTNTLSLEDGGSVDLSDYDDSGTDDQNLILTSDVLTIENGSGSVDLNNYLGTDDQLLTYSTETNILSLEDGGAVDLSGLNDSGTDDQFLFFDYQTFTLVLEDGGYADLSILNDSGTDDQTLAEVLAEGNNANSLVIANLADPTDDQDAATKAYVDANSGAESIDDLSDGISNGSSLFLGFLAGVNESSDNQSNTGVGINAMSSVTTGSLNAAFGTVALAYNTTGSNNTAMGSGALNYSTEGSNNSAFGGLSLRFNTTGGNNTAVGLSALYSNTIGQSNTALGRSSLSSNETGSSNTAVGTYALDLTTGSFNTALGASAGENLTTGSNNIMIGNGIDVDDPAGDDQLNIGNLIEGDMSLGTVTFNNAFTFPSGDGTNGQVLVTDGSGTLSWAAQSGGAEEINDLSDAKFDGSSLFLGNGSGASDDGANRNTAVGKNALASNISGEKNVALGDRSLEANTSGISNTSVGHESLLNNQTGHENVAVGTYALTNSTDGQRNSAVGVSALNANLTGGNNSALGYGALNPNTGNNNSAVGAGSLGNKIDGNNNVAIGYDAGNNLTSGSNNIFIGANVPASGSIASNELNIGNLITGDLTVGTVTFNSAFTFPSGDGTNGQVLVTDGSGTLSWSSAAGGDNLGNHTATQAINLDGYMLTGTSGGQGGGIYIDEAGGVYTSGYFEIAYSYGFPITAGFAGQMLIMTNGGDLDWSPFYFPSYYGNTGQILALAEGGELEWVDPGDNLGNHTATQDLNLDGNWLTGDVGEGQGTGGIWIDTDGRVETSGVLTIAGNYNLPTDSGEYGQVITIDEGDELVWADPTGASDIDGLIDGKTTTFGVFLGLLAGTNDDGSNYNTGVGYQAMNGNTSGQRNSALGYQALRSNTTSNDNTAIGYQALNLSTGSSNTAMGSEALSSNTSGSNNVAIGFQTLRVNILHSNNTAVGSLALSQSGVLSNNTAIGYSSLANTSGGLNTALGVNSGSNNITGAQNTAIGANAGPNADTLNNTTALGSNASTTDHNQIRIGNASISSIGGYAAWSNLSDGAFKRNVTEDVSGLEFIMKLRPVTYNLDVNLIAGALGEDRNNTPDDFTLASRNEKSKVKYTGFIAQEVEQAATEAGYDFSGVDKPKNANSFYALRYATFVVPLVKSVQELKKENEELKAELEDLKSKVDLLIKNLSE